MPDTKKMATHSSSAKKVIDVLGTSLATYVEFGVYLVCGIFVARVLGPENYGVYAFSVWLCGWFILLANNGLTITAIRTIAHKRGEQDLLAADQSSRRFRRWHLLSTVAVIAGGTALIIIFPPKEWVAHLPLFILAMILAVWSRATLLMNVSIGKGFEDFRMGNFSGVLGALLSGFLLVAWWYANGSLIGYFFIYAVSGLIAMGASHFFLRRHLPSANSLSTIRDDAALRQTVLTGFYVILLTLSSRTFETALLKAHHATELVGFFAIAGTLSKGILDLLTSGFDKVLLPSMAKKVGVSGNEGLVDLLSHSTRLYWFFGMLASGFGLVCTESLIEITYGAKFAAAAFPTKVCLVVGGLTAFAGALNATQLSTGNHKERIYGCVVSVIANLAASFALIPTFGLLGAVMALVVGVVTNALVSAWQVNRRFKPSFHFKEMVRLFVAHLIAVAIALVLDHYLEIKWRMFATGFVFLMCFIAISVLMKSWKSSDFQMLASVFEGRGKFGNRMYRWFGQAQKRFSSD
jgi:O-antigen/teichoic acid export membrane protein